MNKTVSIVGSVGVPAKYGGFETLVENILEKKGSEAFNIIVFCSGKSYSTRIKQYKSARLRYVPLSANGIFSIVYDIYSIIYASFISDVVLILGVSGCICLPFVRLFCNKKIIVNIDGLEHKRKKWGRLAKLFLKFSEKLAVKNAHFVIADNVVIKNYVLNEYKSESVVIEYGGDHVFSNILSNEEEVLKAHFLTHRGYFFGVCRIEPENNIDLILDAFSLSNRKLVMVGNWNNSKYGTELRKRFSKFSNIMFLNPIYDLNVLFHLRNCAFGYVHGHSAGGTNPSLVEAMFFQIPIFCFDVPYNRETTEYSANYFDSSAELRRQIETIKSNDLQAGMALFNIAQRRYVWQKIASKYFELF